MTPALLAGAASRLPGMLRAQWLPPARLARLQTDRLARLVAHAYRESPFWQDRFRAAGLRPADVRTAADLRALPPMTREDLQEPARILARGADRKRLKETLTSGSTGRRTTSFFDREAWVTGKILLKLRARLAAGARPLDRIALVQEHQGEQRGPRLGRVRSFSIHAPLAETLEAMVAFGPAVVYGFPGSLALLGEAAGDRLRPRLVFTSGELLDAGTRRRLEHAFAAPVLDVYGCTETKEVAWQCPRADGYHVNADWMVVEIEPDRQGEPTGRILITPLFNYAWPLLRYEVGDTGRLIETACGCGRSLPLIRPTSGRMVDYFTLADGTRLTPYDLTCAIEHVPGLRRYQIVQHSLERVEVRVQPDPGFDDQSRGQITSALERVLRGLRPEVSLVEAFAAEPSGKFRIVRSDVGQRPPAPGT